MRMLHITERLPFGNGEWQHHDTYVNINSVIAIRPSPEGCVILCLDGEAFDTANDPAAIVAQIEWLAAFTREHLTSIDAEALADALEYTNAHFNRDRFLKA